MAGLVGDLGDTQQSMAPSGLKPMGEGHMSGPLGEGLLSVVLHFNAITRLSKLMVCN